MARNDGIDRTSVRNLAVSDKAVGNTQQHNEREKDSYRNPDIIPQRTSWNVHFKKPTASYTDLFAQLEAAETISTRGLKPDATHYCELVFDVNSAYFDNHGGYEFAKQFYEDAYKAAVQIVGGEQYILSAVMHADEINRAMTEALGREVYHYHLHVVYVPVVEKLHRTVPVSSVPAVRCASGAQCSPALTAAPRAASASPSSSQSRPSARGAAAGLSPPESGRAGARRAPCSRSCGKKRKSLSYCSRYKRKDVFPWQNPLHWPLTTADLN